MSDNDDTDTLRLERLFCPGKLNVATLPPTIARGMTYSKSVILMLGILL